MICTTSKTQKEFLKFDQNQALKKTRLDLNCFPVMSSSSNASLKLCNKADINGKSSVLDYSLWHHRLGHAPMSKLQHIPFLKSKCTNYSDDKGCLTCPLAKHTKTPYPLSTTVAALPFDLIHVDIWGPLQGHVQRKISVFPHCCG